MSDNLNLDFIPLVDGESEVTLDGNRCPLDATSMDVAGRSEGLTRRDFLKAGIGALGILAALEVGGASLLFLQSKSVKGSYGKIITAGPVENFPQGSVTEFADARFFLVRSQEGGFLALHNRCPHLGCSVIWDSDENQFLCPCHASKFDIHGDYEAPPVPRPLDIFAVQIEEGVVKVDTSTLQKRLRVSLEQLVYV